MIFVTISCGKILIIGGVGKKSRKQNLPPGITPVPPAIPAAVFATRFPYRFGVTYKIKVYNLISIDSMIVLPHKQLNFQLEI